MKGGSAILMRGMEPALLVSGMDVQPQDGDLLPVADLVRIVNRLSNLNMFYVPELGGVPCAAAVHGILTTAYAFTTILTPWEGDASAA